MKAPRFKIFCCLGFGKNASSCNVLKIRLKVHNTVSVTKLLIYFAESELGILPVKGDETEIISMTPDDHEWLRFEESSRAIILKKALSVDKGAPRIPKWVIYCLPNATNARAVSMSIPMLYVLDISYFHLSRSL